MPTKEQIRFYMQERQIEKLPPPSTAEIRRRLGWDLIADSRVKLKIRNVKIT
ncbi:hypothetical protein [Solimicrobium silvestre]|uniref:Uncharacterized protein n=1 Tax=Solimicrobium silvestre TaxID=2099400 RepID=A0A2S9GXL2_9BURK|nr:hypothetical protein [Solimicrobium silvestre]PRC92462.1 hypothetical protein S2091_2837 [Solimicrobium silvestre]